MKEERKCYKTSKTSNWFILKTNFNRNKWSAAFASKLFTQLNQYKSDFLVIPCEVCLIGNRLINKYCKKDRSTGTREKKPSETIACTYAYAHVL